MFNYYSLCSTDEPDIISKIIVAFLFKKLCMLSLSFDTEIYHFSKEDTPFYFWLTIEEDLKLK